MKIFGLIKFSETSRSLIVSKFILIILEILIAGLSLGSTHQNIAASMRAIPQADEYTSAQGYTISFLVLCLLLQTFEIGMNMLALNIHFDKINSILCVYHFIGVWAFFCYLFDRWRYKTIMYIWVIFWYYQILRSIIPTLLEVLSSINGYYYYGIHEHRKNEAIRQQQHKEYLKKKQEEERKLLEDEGQPLNQQDNMNPVS